MSETDNKNLAEKYLEIAEVMMVVINKECKVESINRKGCQVLGYKKEEIIGKDWFDNFLPEDIRKDVKDVFKKLIKGEIEPVEYYENTIVTKKGETRIIAWHNTTIKDEQGNIIGTLSSGSDITEQKLNEEEIIQKNKELRNFNKLAVGRELKMAELKRRIKELEEELHQK